MSAIVYRPYLGLPARLSQIWLNRWTLLLFLVFAHLVITLSLLRNDLANAKQDALAACTALELAGSIFASVPHYMANGLNKLTAKGVEASVSALGTTLELVLTGVEGLVVYVIDAYKNTYICLFTLAVDGSLEAVLSAAEDATSFLNSTLSRISTDILNDVSSAESTIEAAVEKALNGVGSILGVNNINIPQISIPSIAELSNISIPDTVGSALQTLNQSLPTFDEVKNATDEAISFPFELLKKDVSATFSNFSFNSSVLPVPPTQTVQFCSNNSQLNDFFDNLDTSVRQAFIIMAVLVLLGALLSMVPYAALEWWSWRKLRSHANTAEVSLSSMEKPDFLEIVNILMFPTTYKLSTFVGSKFSSPRTRVLIHWFFSYIMHPRALLVLAVAVAAFSSCLLQTVLVNQIQKAVPNLVAEVTDLESLISTKVQEGAEVWVNGTNTQIADLESFINNNLLGWARNGSEALNNTLSTFVETTVTTIQSVFANTPLETPILDVVNCLILMKVEGIQSGLTFINENAQVQLPRVDNSSFDLNLVTGVSGLQSQQDPGSSLADILNGVIVKWQGAIRQQEIVAGLLLAAYVLVVLMGLARVFSSLKQKERNRAEGIGIRPLRSHDIRLGRTKMKPDAGNPFDDANFECQPGPTPSSHAKQ